ncbi:hypothetical protein FNV43_RR04297 [Rhamnella rubrinervis]|uniref:Uncharacterized protein n=1 Tax=Rhamnella rubrinervis TaxID=2594499 RepID=A0A8K0HJA9_9ROSA|nr:hypothetical protein FNV43_RR04297 [Rhamnella rubrinervis]
MRSEVHSCIEFAKCQSGPDRNYKNLLEKVFTYFSHETLFGEENSTQATMTMEGMKKKLGEIKKREQEKRRGMMDQKALITRKANIPTFQTPEVYSSCISISVPPDLSYFIRCSMKILSFAIIDEVIMAQLCSEVTDLRWGVMDQKVTISKLKKKTRHMNTKGKLKEDSIQKLQDSLSSQIEYKYPDLDLSWVYKVDKARLMHEILLWEVLVPQRVTIE